MPNGSFPTTARRTPCSSTGTPAPGHRVVARHDDLAWSGTPTSSRGRRREPTGACWSAPTGARGPALWCWTGQKCSSTIRPAGRSRGRPSRTVPTCLVPPRSSTTPSVDSASGRAPKRPAGRSCRSRIARTRRSTHGPAAARRRPSRTALLAGLAVPHQSDLPQHPQVLGRPRLSDPQFPRQLGHRPRTRPQQHQDLSALRLGDRVEDVRRRRRSWSLSRVRPLWRLADPAHRHTVIRGIITGSRSELVSLFRDARYWFNDRVRETMPTTGRRNGGRGQREKAGAVGEPLRGPSADTTREEVAARGSARHRRNAGVRHRDETLTGVRMVWKPGGESAKSQVKHLVAGQRAVSGRVPLRDPVRSPPTTLRSLRPGLRRCSLPRTTGHQG